MLRAAVITSNPVLSSIRLATRTVTANTTATATDTTIRCDATAAAITVTLQPAATVARQVLVVKKLDASANTVTVKPNGSETIDGDVSMMLGSRWQSVIIQSNGATWDVLAAS